jgi:hypothetical protein
MPVQKPAAKKAGNARSERMRSEEHQHPQHDNGGGDGAPVNKADAFDKAKATGSCEPGKYEAIISEFVLQKPDEKGQSARIKYEIATDGDQRGTEVTQFYKMFEADETPGKGLNFLKRDLAILGYPDVKFGDLEDVFEEVVEKQIGVNVQVKQNGQWTNIYLNGLCEDNAVIDDYLANRTF